MEKNKKHEEASELEAEIYVLLRLLRLFYHKLPGKCGDYRECRRASVITVLSGIVCPAPRDTGWAPVHTSHR